MKKRSWGGIIIKGKLRASEPYYTSDGRKDKNMIKILQYGEGNFLRTFADVYFDTLNKEGVGEYGVHIVKPISWGSLENFSKKDNKYHIVLRGAKDGCAVEEVYSVDSLIGVTDPFTDLKPYLALASDPELKIIVSNTTEAGICYSDKDSIDGFDGITYPAKLTKFLYERWRAGLGGVYILPVELIDNNADALLGCVEKYISHWGLPEAFSSWNREENYYCNTLVDRIVSGHPRDEATREHLSELIGEYDPLMSVGEPFGLWAIERKGDIGKYIKEGVHNIEVVLTDDIAYYKKRKVRVLNGSHTNLVPAGLILGAVTVYDCMKDERLSAFVEDTLKYEINPFVSDDLSATEAFAGSIKERFLNPYLDHQLTSIALNSISKWQARVLPSFRDYYAKGGVIPHRLTVGFSYLMALYSRLAGSEGAYTVKVADRIIELKDEREYLDYFRAGGSVREFMKRKDVFGEDLTLYKGFVSCVEDNLKKINEGISLI